MQPLPRKPWRTCTSLAWARWFMLRPRPTRPVTAKTSLSHPTRTTTITCTCGLLTRSSTWQVLACSPLLCSNISLPKRGVLACPLQSICHCVDRVGVMCAGPLAEDGGSSGTGRGARCRQKAGSIRCAHQKVPPALNDLILIKCRHGVASCAAFCAQLVVWCAGGRTNRLPM